MKSKVFFMLGLALFLTGRALADDAAVAVRVNGVPISVESIDKLAAKIASGAKTPTEQVWGEARDQLVTLEVLVQQANAEKLSVSPAELDKETAEFKTQMGGPQLFAKYLQDSNSTEEQMREETRRSLLVEKLFERHVSVKVSDKEIEDYYKANEDQFQHPEMVRASHISIKIPNPSAAEASRQRATEILQRAKKGEDFARLAKEFSEDSRTKDQGGDLGFFPQRSTQVAEAAFKLKPGEVSDIVESSYGLHIIKVVARRPEGLAPLVEVKSDIKSMIEDDQREEKEDAYVDQLKKKAKIELLIDKSAAGKASTKQP